MHNFVAWTLQKAKTAKSRMTVRHNQNTVDCKLVSAHVSLPRISQDSSIISPPMKLIPLANESPWKQESETEICKSETEERGGDTLHHHGPRS